MFEPEGALGKIESNPLIFQMRQPSSREAKKQTQRTSSGTHACLPIDLIQWKGIIILLSQSKQAQKNTQQVIS